MAGVLQGRRVTGLEALPGSGLLKFTPEQQLNVQPVGVAGSSTVILKAVPGFIFEPVPGMGLCFKGVN